MPPSRPRHHLLAAAVIGGSLLAANPAGATLTLLPAGAGFTLTTAIGGFPFSSAFDYTLVSVAINPAGQLVAPANTGVTYVFNDADGQTLANNIGGLPPLPSGNGFSVTNAGGIIYGAQGFGGGFYKFNNDGSINSALTLSGLTGWLGMWTNPVTNHIVASTNLGLVDIDPLASSYTVVNALAGFYADGVTVTPDGTIAYVADYVNDHVRGYYLTGSNFGLQSYDSGYLGHGSDGMGVLAGTCPQAGQIVVDNNDGTIGLINPSSPGETVIASGGNRGDYASLDTNNGTLFLSQNDQLARLKAPTGCSIGVVLTSAPEPASLAILGMATAGLVGLRRRSARPVPA